MGLLARLRRPDWLAELQAVLAVGLGLLVLGGGFLVVAWAAQGSVTVDLLGSGVSGTMEYGLADGAEVVATQPVAVTVADPSLGQLLSFALTRLPRFGLVVTVLVLLLRIVGRARRTDPFTLATVRRLRVLAWVMLVGGLAATLVEFAATFYLAGTVSRPEAAYSVHLWWLLAGFAVLAVAEVVRRGCDLRDELDTVV